MPILLCKTADNNVPESPGKWRAGEIVTAVADDHVFMPIEQTGAGAFHHIKVLGVTLEQVQAYLQEWASGLDRLRPNATDL